MPDKTRSIEREIFIGAPPERVWRAITTAEEIVNWFALEAETEAGVGGFIGLSWKIKSMEPDYCHILDWKPGARLLMTWRDAPGGEHELPVEITLKRRGGGTYLRLVHSGFLSEQSWDEEYESHGRGWSYELRSLKYYLERFRDRPRRYARSRFALGDDWRAAWRALIGPSAAFAPAVDGPGEGTEFTLRLPDGTMTFAELLYAFDERDFVVAVDVLRGGLFRIELEMVSEVPEIWIWAFSWRMSEAELKAVVEPMFAVAGERLGIPARTFNQ